MGGDNAPQIVIEGAAQSKIRHPNLKFSFLGNKDKIVPLINSLEILRNSNVIHTDEIIDANEKPSIALRKGKHSSMGMAIQLVKSGKADAIVSAGNTGALMAMSKLILRPMDGITRPAIAAYFPTIVGESCMLDLGANIECDEKNLVEFSEMGSALHKALFPKEKTKVALLNVGSEEIKGTEIIKKAHNKLKEISINEDFDFNGYIEGNRITDGESNVIVTDGFTGNIALKTAEGTAKFITDNLKLSLKENIFSKFSILFSYFSLKKFKEKLDPRKFNGAIFLGLNGPVVKSHGSTDSIGFYHSIDLCYNIVKGNLMSQIKDNLSHLNDNKI